MDAHSAPMLGGPGHALILAVFKHCLWQILTCLSVCLLRFQCANSNFLCGCVCASPGMLTEQFFDIDLDHVK